MPVFRSVKLELVWVLETLPSVIRVARFALVWTSVWENEGKLRIKPDWACQQIAE